MNRFNDILNWAADRNLVSGSTPDKQFLKLVEEVGEIAHGLARDNQEEIIDGIGDVVVVLTILAAQRGIHIEHCIECAWNEIKDRKGKMIDGVFVKESDL